MDLDGGIGLAGQRKPELRRFSHEAMNTVFEVHTANADARYAAEAAQAAFALVDRLEGELSRFRPNSDITRLNHLPAGERTRVGEAALECLLIARHVYDLTDGAFDIAIGTGLPSLEIDADAFEVRATADGVRLDLGGIGKGYVVDLVAELLEEWGLDRAFVHGGFSSAVALEPPAASDGWPLTLSDPCQPSRVFCRLSPKPSSLAAVRSAAVPFPRSYAWASRWFPKDGGFFHSISFLASFPTASHAAFLRLACQLCTNSSTS